MICTKAAVLLVGALLPIAVQALGLNITAVTANATGSSVFECWALYAPLETTTQPGLVGAASSFLGDVANMTYTVTSAGFDGGDHHAPYNQWVVPLSGFGIVTLPDDPGAGLYATRGLPNGLIFAADTADVSHLGHGGVFPGYTSTIILQIPTVGNKVPEHTVLHAGQCTSNDTIGLDAL
ncbi:hypothetical protein PG993_005727 [Apiospora rasikravindrae]|uniref:Small secreted protein n=1 Tax=Apiospora rasikravindrae TaxID=990691 RepID=A0ABR1TA77_9PEZI